jgi:hypothetical protein
MSLHTCHGTLGHVRSWKPDSFQTSRIFWTPLSRASLYDDLSLLSETPWFHERLTGLFAE